MFTPKKRLVIKHKSARPYRSQRGLRHESLENRRLLAAAIMDTAPIDSHAGMPAGVVSTVTAGSLNDSPIAFIVNGEQTSGYESVGIVNNGCTGTLINPTHVLTAAHCVETGGGGFIGDRDGTFEVDGQTYRTSKVIVHPNYDPFNFGAGYDLAIMELDRPVIGVTPSDINRTTPSVGQMLTLVGFGEAGTSNSPSHGFGVKHVGTTPIEAISNVHISWTLDSINESATAPGDSGGPAFINVGGKLVVAGVTSGGSGDAHSIGAESFDTRVDTLAGWIDAQVGDTPPVDPPTDPDPPVDPPVDPGGPIDNSAIDLARQELADYDLDGNGSLSVQELTQEFLDLGDRYSEALRYAESLIRDFDTSGDGELDFHELVVSWGGQTPVDPPPVDPPPVEPPPVDPPPATSEAEQLALDELANYDTDGNGSLSLDELIGEFLDQGSSWGNANDLALQLLHDFDADGNHSLSYSELVTSWGGNAGDSGAGDSGDDWGDDWGGDWNDGWGDWGGGWNDWGGSYDDAGLWGDVGGGGDDWW